jgi:hypothetical protein
VCVRFDFIIFFCLTLFMLYLITAVTVHVVGTGDGGDGHVIRLVTCCPLALD